MPRPQPQAAKVESTIVFPLIEQPALVHGFPLAGMQPEFMAALLSP
jgi:hypothetical protein